MANSLQEGSILVGPLFNEPMRIETLRTNGEDTWVLGLVRAGSQLLQRVDEEIEKACEDKEKGITGAEGCLAQAENRHAELSARSERRLLELERQRSLSLKAIERLASAIVLLHQEREAPEIRHMRPNPETKAAAMRAVMDCEAAQGRLAYDVREKNPGYDITSLELNSGELRLIEVQGLADARGTIMLTPNKRRVAEDRRDCYRLYVVSDCASEPVLQKLINGPARFPWHEVTKVAHYWLEIDAIEWPMEVRQAGSPRGDDS